MCIEKHLYEYMQVKSRPEKSRIVTAIVESIRRGASNSGGGFVRKVSVSWNIENLGFVSPPDRCLTLLLPTSRS